MSTLFFNLSKLVAEMDSRTLALLGFLAFLLTMLAQVDAILANIKSQPAAFQGAPEPPTAWPVALMSMAPVAFAALVGMWGCGAWHFLQSAQATAAHLAEEEVRNPLLLSSLRGLNNEEPGKTYTVAAFLAVQVLAVLVGSTWRVCKTWRKGQPVPQTSGLSA